MNISCFWDSVSYWGGIFGVFLTVFGLFYGGWRLMYKWLWLNREKWSASLLDSPIPLKGKETTNWRTDRPIQIRDTFVLDIRKPNGKGRIIDKIEFRRGAYSSAEHPKQVKVTVEPGNVVYDELDVQPGHNVVVNFGQPKKVTFIAVEVTDIYPNRHWAVGDIKLREIRLFGKFWTVNIE